MSKLQLLINRKKGYSFKNIDVTDDKKCPSCSYELRNDIIGEINKQPSQRFSFF